MPEAGRDTLEVDATVREALPNALFRVELATEKRASVTAHVAGESGLLRSLKDAALRKVGEGIGRVLTDAKASPTGFPFKVLGLEGTLAAIHDHEGEVDIQGKRVRARLADLRVVSKAAPAPARAEPRHRLLSCRPARGLSPSNTPRPADSGPPARVLRRVPRPAPPRG